MELIRGAVRIVVAEEGPELRFPVSRLAGGRWVDAGEHPLRLPAATPPATLGGVLADMMDDVYPAVAAGRRVERRAA